MKKCLESRNKMGKSFDRDISFTQNRELSWLAFNQRVLEEAMDYRVPPFEKYKFISIFTSNLDEFFMVRVGSLLALSSVKKKSKGIDSRTGMSPKEQLEAIYEKIPHLYQLKDRLTKSVESTLALHNITRLEYSQLTKEEKAYVYEYFYRHIYPVVTPVIVDVRHPFIHIENNQICGIARLSSLHIDKAYGVVNLPKSLSRAIFLSKDSRRFILIEEVILTFMKEIFEGFTIVEKGMICITRNADMDLDEAVKKDSRENLRQQFRKALKKRAKLSPVRMEWQGGLSKETLKFLLNQFGLSKKQVYLVASPLKMDYVFGLEGKLSQSERDRFCYPSFKPLIPKQIDVSRSMIRQIETRDILLHYPFDSMEPFLKLLKEAAEDETVLSIKITIYRLASISKVAEYLSRAAENGKEVTVLMELRARFDEGNNIDWSERLEQAGCQIIYGIEEYKVHSKVCLITRKDKDKIKYITQIGTGNYNEKTSKQYTDFSLMTANQAMGEDANLFFKHILMSEIHFPEFTHLVASPFKIKEMILQYIDREIDRVKSGKEGYIFLKCNSVTERDIIDKLSDASRAGVKVDMVIRGICCILPKVEERTENIRIISLVGRFLEHHRLYIFGHPSLEDRQMYISSADLMTRNLQRRIELACPILDEKLRRRLEDVVATYLEDGQKAKVLAADGTYHIVSDKTMENAQERLMSKAKERATQDTKEAKSSFERVIQWFKWIFGGSM